MSEDVGGFVGCMFSTMLFFAAVAGWFQHLYTCFTENHWGFLIAGAIFFPVAVCHGWGIWFGFWH